MKRLMQVDCSDILQELESWYARDNGPYLFRATRAAALELIDTAFGYHILQLGLHGEQALCDGSPINHRLFCSQRYGPGVNVVTDPDELPFDSDSVDVVIAHHCLEFARNPHQVLREIQRVLTPQGQLLVIGFNPYSLSGARMQIRRLMRDPLWTAHRPVGEHRLTDWLHLLNCEVIQTRRLYGLPPMGSGRVRQWLTRADTWTARHKLPIDGLFILHAVKQVAAAHKPRKVWRGRRARLISLVPKPVTTPVTRKVFSGVKPATDAGNAAA